MGGSFGQKAGLGREDVAVIAACSKLLGRPVKWIEDRVENLTVGGQARDERTRRSPPRSTTPAGCSDCGRGS